MFSCTEDTFRRFKHLAIDNGVSNARLLERLLDAHQQLLEWQAQRDQPPEMSFEGRQLRALFDGELLEAQGEAFERVLDEGLNGPAKDGAL